MSNIQDYDEAAIDLCGNFAENFFNNFDKFKDQYKPDFLFFGLDFDVIKKRNALDNYILKYYSKLDDRNPVDASIKRNMDRYLAALYKRFLSRPSELLGSPFLKSPKIVNMYCPAEIQINGINVNLRNRVKETYRSSTQDFQQLYFRDMISNDLSKEDSDRFMHMLISKIGTDDKQIQKCQEEYLKKLIQQKRKVSELTPKQVEFIAKYVNNFMLKSRLKELGYDFKNYIYVGEAEKNLGGFETRNSIYINMNSDLTKDIPSLIQTVFHETEHSIQELEATKNPNSKIGLDLAISNVLRNYYSSEKKYNVYHNNYRFEQIEQDSEHIGYTQAIIFLDMLGFRDESKKMNDIRVKRSDLRQFEYDYRIDENGRKSTREQFFFNSLNKAIAKRPDMLKKYPTLLLLYTPDGKVKSFEDIVTGDFQINDPSKSDILADFCKYYISKGALDNFDISKFPEEVQANIASRLTFILVEESLQIGKMGDNHYNNIDKNDKKHVESFHLRNSESIMRFMNKNYLHFMELQDKGKFTSNININYYNSYTGFFRYDSNYRNLTSSSQSHMEELKQLAFEAEKQKNLYRSKKRQKFTPSSLETSFHSLVDNSRLSGFSQATQEIKNLSNENIIQNEYETEEK